MNRYIAADVAVFVVMLALDMLWLGVVAKAMYQQAIGHLMAETPNISAALVFDAIYTAGLVVFAVAPHAQDQGWGRTLLAGALFGLVAYATYDLCNLATLKNWPLHLALVDMAWGALISAASAGAGRAAMAWASKA